MSDPLDLLGVAAMRKLRAQQELAAANASLAAALRLMAARPGEPKCRVGQHARAYLGLHGFGPEEMTALGISDSSVRNMLDAG